MLNQINQTNITDTEIMAILDCNNDDDLYSIFEVATSSAECLF